MIKKSCTVALLQNHEDTCAVSFPCATLLKTSFVLWHFCRAKKILVQYLCYAHFWGDLCQPCWKQVLYCGTFAEPKRYFCSIFAIHMVLGGISVNPVERKFFTVALLQSQKDTFAVSLLSFVLRHFCRAKKILLQYLCYPHGLGGGFSVNPVESFVLWHFCRAKKILLQYLCYPHGFGGESLSIL